MAHGRLVWGCSRSSLVLSALNLLSPAAAAAASRSSHQVHHHSRLLSSFTTRAASSMSAAAPPSDDTKLKSYGNIAPPHAGECRLWSEEVLPQTLEAKRKIFCNRALNMTSIKAMGFDMDYTLAQYRADSFEELAHSATVDKLVNNFNYPQALRDFKFKYTYMTKGLVIDKHRGNMLKVDRHKYVKVATHGFKHLTTDERANVYNATDTSSITREALFEEPEYAMVDTLFSLAEAHLFMDLVQFKDAHPDTVPGRKSYAAIYRDLRTAVDHCHRDGSLKKAVAADPAAFIHPDPLLKEVLVTLRASGRQVFLATNSLWDYTNVVMNFLLEGKVGSDRTLDWLTYFDVVFTGCSKPNFFTQRAALFSVDVNTGLLQNTDNGAPTIAIDEQDMASEPPHPAAPLHQLSFPPPLSASSAHSNGSASSSGNGGVASSSSGSEGAVARDAAGSASTTGRRATVFQGGHYKDLHGLVGVNNGSEVLYVGDHIYGDILKSKKSIGWRTMLVVPELEFELQMKARTQSVYQATAVLRGQRDRVCDQIQRLEYLAKCGGVRPEHVQQHKEEIKRLHTERVILKERHSLMLHDLHTAFHPVWGQLLKTGHQNSRFAHQLERFACLYTSHVSNLAFVSPDKSYAGRMDYMAHEELLL